MANIRRALWLGVLLLVCLGSMAWAQLPVADDSYVTSTNATTNSGNSPSLVLQQSTNGTTLIKFDISPLQAAGVTSGAIDKAYLKLYTSAVTGQGTFDLYQITSTWAEGTVTYNTKPSMTLVAAGTTCPSGVQCVNTASKYVQIDITSLVQGWLTTPGSNFGVALKPNSTTISVTFESKESTTTSHAPELDIVYNNNLGQLPGMIGPGQVGPGTYGISITGTAAGLSGPIQLCQNGQIAIGITSAGNAVCLVGPLSIANGGTGASNAATALSNLGGLSASALTAETSARQSADAAEATARAAADVTLQTSINSETARAQAAEALKADLAGNNTFGGINNFTNKVDMSGAITFPVQTTGTTPPASGQPNVCANGQLLLQVNGQPGQQLFVCNPTHDGWALINDDTTSVTSAKAYTDQQVAAEAASRQTADTTLQNNINAEATARQAADSAEATARAAADAAEILARQQGDAATVVAANTYTDNAKTNILTQPQTFSGDETFSGNNSFGGMNTFTNKVDMSGAITFPVQTTNMTPPSSGHSNGCASGQLLLQVNGQPGQQLFVCNAAQDGWDMINDDTASINSATSAAKTYTDQQVAAEAAARQAADSAEATARAAADAAEILARQQGDAASVVAANTYTDNAKTNILTQPQTFSGDETFSGNNSFGGMNTFTNKVDMSGAITFPVQTTSATPPPSGHPNACASGQLLLQTNGQPGQQLFVCNTNQDGWDMINDDTASINSATAAAKTYTDQQVGIEKTRAMAAETGLQNNINTETASRITGDANTLAAANTFTSGAVAAEATLRAAGDTAAVVSANGYTDSQVATINTSLAGKADKNGGNTFTGDQTITGNLSIAGTSTVNGSFILPALQQGNAPSASQILDLQGWDGTKPTKFELFVNNSGNLDLFTATGGNAAVASGLTIAPDGKITFANGQMFPGTQNSLTAGTGININSNTISNTGVLSFNGRNGVVTPASGDYSFSQISGAITPVQAGAGLYAIDISGNAATATSAGTAGTATLAANSTLLGGAAPATAATAGTIAARDSNGDLFANVFHGSGASLTNIPSSALPNNIAFTDAANVFSATQAFAPMGATSLPSNVLRFNATDASSVSQTAQLQALADGSLSLQFGPTAGPISPKLNIDKNGIITFAGGQTFPGAQTLTAGTGISIVSNAINNTGVTSLTGTANQITASASTGAVTLSLPSTLAVNISGNAATATNATTATSAATANAVAFNGIANGTNTTATMTVGTGGTLTTSGTGVINASQLGGIAAANYARTDQGNTFAGQNILGDTATASGGLLIPANHNGSSRPSFPFDMEATNTGSNTHLFRIIAQDGGTPNWDFQFCATAPCTPTDNGLSIAGQTGIITFASGQTFPANGVTQVNTGTGLTGGPITTTGTIALANSGVTAGTYTKVTVDATGRATAGAQALFTDIGGSIVPAQVGAGTYGINISGSAGSAAVATTATNASNLLLGTTVAGNTTWTNVAAPATPAAGHVAVYTDSTTKQLCAKDDAGNVNCVSSNGSGPSVFTSGSATAQTGAKIIHGSGTLNGGGNLTVTFATSFTSATSYDCNASDTGGTPAATSVQNQTANSIKLNGTGNHTLSFVCIGT